MVQSLPMRTTDGKNGQDKPTSSRWTPGPQMVIIIWRISRSKRKPSKRSRNETLTWVMESSPFHLYPTTQKFGLLQDLIPVLDEVKSSRPRSYTVHNSRSYTHEEIVVIWSLYWTADLLPTERIHHPNKDHRLWLGHVLACHPSTRQAGTINPRKGRCGI